MIYKKQIEQEIKELTGLMDLVQIYGEVASTRMKKIRDSVLKNRNFLNSIHDIFKDALVAYAQKVSQTKRGHLKSGQHVTLLAHNGKTVAVYISANTGFYGDVVQKTFNAFLNDIKNTNVETTIIGKVGLSLFTGAQPNRPYTYFSLPDFGVSREGLAEVIKHLVKYEEMWIYYGQYYSVVTQKPDKVVISAGATIGDSNTKPKEMFLFEPSIEKILMFFETEIFTSLFDQAIRESQLAKFASRIMAMDEANENIKKRLAETKLFKMRTLHGNANRKQLNTLAPIMETM